MQPRFLGRVLVHSCDVKRRGAGAVDALGHATGAFTVAASGVACRWASRLPLDPLAPEEVQVERWQVWFAAGVVVEIGDVLEPSHLTGEYQVQEIEPDVAGAGGLVKIRAMRVGKGIEE